MYTKRSRRTKRHRMTVPAISLTPLIDTALTLLIIFMVTTPMIHNAIKVNLPKGQAQEGGKQPQELVVSIDKTEKIYVNSKPVSLDSLGVEIKKLVQAKTADKSVWVKVDGASSCDMLVTVIDRIKFVGGVKDVRVATQKMA